MTTHDTAVKVDVYPDEFKVILIAINHAIANRDDFFTVEEVEKLRSFKDDLLLPLWSMLYE